MPKSKLNSKVTKINKNKIISNTLSVAIVHDFLFQYGGAEKVVEKWLEMYPNAIIFTSFATPEKFVSSEVITKAFEDKRIKITWVQKIFELKNQSGERRFAKFQKHLFWLYPILMRLVTIRDFDVVLISSTDCAKQVRFKRCHQIIHYCHSPTRYLHGLTTEADHKSLSIVYQILIPFFKFFLRKLDLNAVSYLNRQKTQWIANSEFIQAVIWNVYRTRSEIIYPPIETEKFINNPRKINQKESNTKDAFYLCHGRISFHKRLDLAILACLKLRKPLKIGGTAGFAKQMEDLQKIVLDYEQNHPEAVGLVEFLGRTTDKQYLELLSQCRGFLFPGKEDFGIAPVEALAAGVPLIAFGAGGALEYVKDGTNGILFSDQTAEEMIEAINHFETITAWNEQTIRSTSLQFTSKNFETSIKKLVKDHFA